MSTNADEIIVAADGALHIAKLELAPTLPTDSPTSAVDTKFGEVGYLSSEGVTLTATPAVTEITSWQSATPTRRIVTGRAFTAAGQMQQWNMETFAAAYGGGDFSQVAAGVWRYDPPQDQDALVEFAAVIDWADGEKNFRLVIKRATISDAVATNLVRTGAAVLPITLNALAPENPAAGENNAWYLLTDAEEMSLAS